MGHIAHLRKQFKSLKEYDNIITLILRIKKKIYENLLVLHLNKLESPSPKDALCQVGSNGPGEGKFYDNNNDRQMKNLDQKSSLQLLAKMC